MLIYKEDTLQKLIEDFLRGDDNSFRNLAILIHQDVLNISYRYVGNIEDAKDILQEVLIKIHRKVRSFKRRSKASTWIYRLTVNASIDFLRKKRSFFNLKKKASIHKEKYTFSKDKETEDKKKVIENMLKVLPLRQKNAFILKHFEGLKIKEISKILKCSQSSVKTHLRRAVDNLRKIVEVENEMPVK
ncbi:MAG: sigma-70 family RNA polymerase sigma factor [Candidatus Omnitrophica bacterium]|nr:sigma-70 family RNA polymerase sigma factor [Candidatus Omnitrophota bacterium]MBD3268917.1 sigma-70 family RNA polymerase sigma factor [Candidatus Omnitrophota bacterium]